MRTFTFAGSSVRNGKLKVRYANDIMRIKTLEKTGHSAINLMPLPEAMTKLQIVNYFLEIDYAGDDAELQAVIENEQLRLSGVKQSKAAPVTATAESDEDPGDEDPIGEEEEFFEEDFVEDVEELAIDA